MCAFSSCGPFLWNKLPPDLRSNRTVSTCKRGKRGNKSDYTRSVFDTNHCGLVCNMHAQINVWHWIFHLGPCCTLSLNELLICWAVNLVKQWLESETRSIAMTDSLPTLKKTHKIVQEFYFTPLTHFVVVSATSKMIPLTASCLLN